MNARQAIRIGLDQANGIVMGYLGDLTDAELLVRAVPGSNHIAWQLGHLIQAENEMINAVCPGAMPALPAGWEAKYSENTASLDNASAFNTKAEYMNAYEQQHSATLAALEKLSDADLDKPGPEKMKDFVKTVGEVFSIQGTHWMMHAGQWAIVRRKLGRKPLF